MAIADYATKIADIDRSLATAAGDLFDTGDADGNPFTYEYPMDSAKASVAALDFLAEFKIWVGSKVLSDARAYELEVDLETYQKTISLTRKQVEYDSAGVVGARIAGFTRNLRDNINKVIFDKLLTNPTSLYGVALLSTSQPHGYQNATWSNKVTDALDSSSLETGIAAMQDFRKENGDYYGVNPTHLVVAPTKARIALELTGQTRALAITAAGVWPAAASGVAAVGVENTYSGGIQVIVDPRMGGQDSGDWLLMDLGHTMKPMALGIGAQPRVVSSTDLTDSDRFHFDNVAWSVEADLAPSAGAPQLVYGRLS